MYMDFSHWLSVWIGAFGNPEKLNAFSNGRAGSKCDPILLVNLSVLNPDSREPGNLPVVFLLISRIVSV